MLSIRSASSWPDVHRRVELLARNQNRCPGSTVEPLRACAAVGQQVAGEVFGDKRSYGTSAFRARMT